jgi:hypothetical protein
MKLWQKMILGIVMILFALAGIIIYLSQFHFDLSQDYKNVEGYGERENEQSAIISRMINFLSFDPKEKDILSLIKQNLNRTLQE